MSAGNIPGIHNYCDRWCEKCFFTSRCAVYADLGDLTPDEQDIRNKAFWERLSHNFSKAKNMLEQAAEKFGVDLNALSEELEDQQQKEELIREESESHPLSKLSWEYSEVARKWLDVQPGMMEKLNYLKDQLELGAKEQQEAKEQTEIIKDCLAVIQWYSTFIHVKFMRALTGKLNDDGWEKENGYQPDYDGSVKIAIIAVERTMQAWVKLYHLLPDREDDFLRILALLERIKVIALEEFPEAMDFKRPGFDDIK